jgi:hypothetical protein
MADKKTRKRAYIPPTSEVVNRKERTTVTSSRPARGAASAPRGANNPRSANYVYPTPSFKRTAKRLPIYFLLIFALQYWQYGSHDDVNATSRTLMALGTAAAITLVFAPFMHWMDKLSYNRWLKRSGKTAA